MAKLIPIALPKCCESWCARFNHGFRRQAQQKAFRIYLTALLSDRYRDRVARLVSNQSDGSYSGLRHFLQSAPWDAAVLNECRMTTMNACRQTKPQRGFTLIVDDSSQTDSAAVAAGVDRQYVSVQNQKMRYVIRATHLYDGVRNLPLDIDLSPHPYPEHESSFKGSRHIRPDSILTLIDRCLARKQWPGAVVLNGGYSLDTYFINELRHRELTYVAGLPGSCRIEGYIPGQAELQHACLGDIIHKIPLLSWIPAQNSSPDTSTQLPSPRWTATLSVKLEGIEGWHWLLVSLNAPTPATATQIEYLVSNCKTRTFSPEWIWGRYRDRERLTEFYRDARALLNLSEYSVDSTRSLTRHWSLLYAAYSFIVWHQLTGSLQRQTKRKIATFREAVDAYRTILGSTPALPAHSPAAIPAAKAALSLSSSERAC